MLNAPDATQQRRIETPEPKSIDVAPKPARVLSGWGDAAAASILTRLEKAASHGLARSRVSSC
jgi:hypothetical protein